MVVCVLVMFGTPVWALSRSIHEDREERRKQEMLAGRADDVRDEAERGQQGTV